MMSKNINIQLNELMKKLQDLKTEFIKEIEAEMKIDLKNSITELQNTGENLTNVIDQVEDRISK